MVDLTDKVVYGIAQGCITSCVLACCMANIELGWLSYLYKLVKMLSVCVSGC